MPNRKELIEYINNNGKTTSWNNLAKQFNFSSSDAARSFYRRHLAKQKAVNQKTEFKQDSQIFTFNSPVEITNLDQLIALGKVDTEKWVISKYIQNFWGSPADPHWQVKVWLAPKSPLLTYQEKFIDFLKDYKSPHKYISSIKNSHSLKNGCLIFNKQDAHLNKYDIGGDNDIIDRFELIKGKVEKILVKASATSFLEKIIYIVGSDEFNSEFTQCTTKGTPQKNILPYQVAFQTICQHEVQIINLLLEHTSSLEILYVPGNHDEYVGWHMISWLQAYYRDQNNINIDISFNYRKYFRYSNTALMFNHGDAIKPAKLVNIFPIEFKEEWSYCDNYYAFTGDKHHETSIDFNGIKFFQLPALSKSKSLWDDKNGYTTSKAELHAFLMQDGDGLSDIFIEPM